jgi:TolB protein
MFAARLLPASATVQGDPRLLLGRPRLIVLLAILGLLLAAAVAISIGSRDTLPPIAAQIENGVIAFAVDGDIVVVDPATGELRSLIADPAVDQYPVFSPDGSRIAFERTVGNAAMLVSATSAGGDVRELLSEPVEAVRGLTWSPDGSALAFANGDLWVVAADGSGGHRFGPAFRAEFPQWRPPTGADLLFSNNSYPAHFLVRRDGGGVRPLTFPDGTFVNDAFPRWTPDGRSLVSFREEFGSGTSAEWRLHVLTVLDDGRVRDDRVVGPPVLPTVGYYLSPDGARIAFASPTGQGTDWRVGSVLIDGSEPHRMGGPEFSGPPPILGWSPDGTLVIVLTSAPRETWLLDPLDGATSKARWRDPSDEPPAWQALP